MKNDTKETGKVDMTLRQLIRLPSLLSGLLILISSIVIGMDIISRAKGGGVSWAGEVSVYFLVVMSFLGIGFALQSGKHVQVTFLLDKLSPEVNRVLAIVVKILIAIISLIVIYFGMQAVINSYTLDFRSPTMLAVPLFIPQAAIPIGAFFLLLEVIRELLADFSGSKGRK